MPQLPSNTPLGDLEIIEVFAYYDGPGLFVCTNQTNQLYLGVFAASSKEGDTWIYVPLSPVRLDAIRKGELAFFEAFRRAENRFAMVVFLPRGSESWRWDEVHSLSLPAEWLPLEDQKMRYEPTQDPGELAMAPTVERRIRSGREVLAMRLYENESWRHEAPAPVLGRILWTLQSSINAFAQALINPTLRGAISGDILSQTELAVIGTTEGSFEVQFASSGAVNLFGQSLVGESIAELMTLIGMGSDAGRLKSRLGVLKARAASNYRALLREIVSAQTDLRVDWISPRTDRRSTVRMSTEVARDALAIVEAIETILSENLQLECVLVGLNVRTRYYEIKALREDRKYVGRLSDEAMFDVQHATINDIYIATLRPQVESNPVTGEEKVKWALVALKRSEG
jgi:hypothetical protein